jgi:hypothetical protein
MSLTKGLEGFLGYDLQIYGGRDEVLVSAVSMICHRVFSSKQTQERNWVAFTHHADSPSTHAIEAP